jgi:stage V sporulation protein SpoVS
MSEQQQDNKKTEEMRVSRETNVQSLAWRIARSFEEGTSVILTGIGAHVVNTMVKAIVIANGHMAPRGVVFTIFPRFSDGGALPVDLDVPDNERMTAISFDVKPQKVM